MRRTADFGPENLHDAEPRLACCIFGVDDALIAAGISAAAAAASAASKAGDNSGQNKFHAGDNAVDPGAYQYGGQTAEDTAAAEAARAHARATQDAANASMQYGPNSWQAQEARQRLADAQAQLDKATADRQAHGSFSEQDINRNERFAATDINRQGVQLDNKLADQSRGQFGEAIGMYRNAALGKGPSAAQDQLQQGTDRAIAASNATANSARGGGLASAAARRGAMAQAGDLTAQAGAQAGMLRAQEMQAGMQGFAGTAGQQRAQDESRSFNQAQLEEAQRHRNDAMRKFWEQQRSGVRGTTTQVGMAREAANQHGRMGADALNSGIAQANANNKGMMTGQATNAGIAGGAATLDMLGRLV